MTALAVIFWLCAALIVWTQLGYALALALVASSRPIPAPAQAPAAAAGIPTADNPPSR